MPDVIISALITYSGLEPIDCDSTCIKPLLNMTCALHISLQNVLYVVSYI